MITITDKSADSVYTTAKNSIAGEIIKIEGDYETIMTRLTTLLPVNHLLIDVRPGTQLFTDYGANTVIKYVKS